MDEACHPSSDQLKAVALALGAAFKRAREEKGWSVYRLSQESGLDERGIRRIEEGRTSPSFDTMVRIGLALEVGLAAIVAEAEGSVR
ncbi:MAG: helix-turn-helix transcriptional regulator [Verrucomicrobiales bacterium]|nr:helix-turn-helix transcriptional regulator [Verrucomicrobiales bacterium]